MTALDHSEIATQLREAARRQREHLAVTYEHGVTLVNLVCEHGDFLADAIKAHTELPSLVKEATAEAIKQPLAWLDKVEDEYARLRASRDDLLAAAKFAIAQADRDTTRLADGTPNRTGECWESYHKLQAAINKAESLP